MPPVQSRAPGAFQPGSFMHADVWLDEDGRHVGLAHDCAHERVVTMLPYPNWRAVGGKVEPSISCEACGLHTFGLLGAVSHVEPAEQEARSSRV
jgi:hypothetical protein